MWRWLKNLFRKKKIKEPKKPVKPKSKPIMIGGTLVDIELHELEGFNEAQRQFFVSAMRLKLQILSSQEFKDKFLGMSASEKNKHSQIEIYQNLLNGKDHVTKQLDYDIDLAWALYGDKDQRSKTIGYTYKNNLKVYTHRFHYNNWMNDPFGEAFLAGHATHEYFHNLGPGYIHRYIKKRSLVYKTGFLVRQLGIKDLKGQKLTPIS